jgi:signal transduction histidine kinase/DNA-binding response OmpR family regulator
VKTDLVENLSPMPVAASLRKGKEQQAADASYNGRVRDPREMERAELEAYLQSTEAFPTKASLLEFARRYNVPVNARTQREEIIRLCLRMLYDIPASFAGLRDAERAPTPRTPEAETRKVLAHFFAGAKSGERPDGQSIKKITTDLLESVVHCHETGLLLTQVRGADAEMFLHALEMCEGPIETHVRFLSNLVDFARLEAGKYELVRTSFRLRDCLEETLKRLAASAHQKKLELCYTAHPDAPERVIGDPVRLQQILTHLVENAIKFTDSGEIVVEVQSSKSKVQPQSASSTTLNLEPETLNSSTLCFSVRDTGVGMTQEQQQALMHLFSSADGSSTAPLRGLGLAIAHKLVELAGGHIWVESAAHGGSVCSFSLPLSSDTSENRASSTNFHALQGKPILVADDNATCRRILEELLLSWGAHPHPAASGREALAHLYKQPEDDPFAAIIIDGHLADIEGFASIRRQHLAEDPALVSPLIMTLASLDPGREMEHHRELSVAAFLHKPITPAELLHALCEALTPGAASPEGDAIDRTALWSLVGGEAALLREVIGLFEQDCPRFFFALQHAVLMENRQEIIAAAHALKGAVSHFAAPRVLRVLAVIENFGGQGDLTHTRDAMMQLMAELSRLKLALDELKQELSTTSAAHER